MSVCPRCWAEVKPEDANCPACGLSIGDETAATSIKPEGQDHTPTKIKSTEAGKIHTTSPGSGARFVAGHVLAGRYRIVGLIGKGGMGEVYKAEDLELEQTVALKFLPEKLSKEEDLLKRFRREVRNARQVSHPNVCRVFDIGETEGLYYITMEFIEGDDLSMLLTRIGRLPSDKAVEISRQICLGLGAIHKAGILHRDLKPSNIIIDQKGEARITDFGIAGIEAEVQGEEARVGTPAYMSPEQITGKEVTKRSDIYSLGLLLYEIFTGKQAFEGSSVQELREKHTRENPTNPSEIVTGINPVVEDLIERCLKKDPEERPDSALKVAMMLPGGNPLQVALEAGETPTPEMVAAAPSSGSLGRITGLLLFAGYAAFLLLWIYLHIISLDVVTEPITRSRDVLVERAGEVSRTLGYTDPPADYADGFDVDYEVLGFANEQKDPEALWEKFRIGRPSVIRFDYRQSPELLIPSDEDGAITETDPSMTVPGMIRLELDVNGRLLKFAAVPPKTPSPPDSERKADWEAVFREAGLDLSKFETVDPSSAPIYNYDEIKAWKGELPDNPGIEITVEAAAFRGRPVSFDIFGPWNKPGPKAADSRQMAPTEYLNLFFILVILVIFLGAVLLARYNMKKGRGDVKGALKIAVFFLVVRLVTDLIFTEKIGSVSADTNRILEVLQNAPFNALLVFAVYLAIEPILRKWFPEMLVSWNRLVAGNFRDQLVGRDVLTGLFIGVSFATVSFSTLVVSSRFTGGLYLPGALMQRANIITLYGSAWPLAAQLGGISVGLMGALLFLLVFLVAFLITRRKWAAAIIWFLFFAVPTALAGLENGYAWAILGPATFFGVILFCYLRFGFLTAVGLSIAVPDYALYAFDPARFYFPATMTIVGFQLAIAFAAFLIATRGQPWIRGDLLE
jgi:tRNA A-37 threonylcarbamoyl transferase component Bud32